MITFLEILALLFIVVGVLGSILPALPGPPICYVGMLLVHWSTGAFDTNTLLMWAVIVVVVTILDNLLPIWFTKKFGGSKAGERGAMAGVLAGFIFGPVGIIVGPFVGALLGELINDSSDRKRAVRSGWGSFLSFFVGTGIKLAVSLWLTIEIFVDVFKNIF